MLQMVGLKIVKVCMYACMYAYVHVCQGLNIQLLYSMLQMVGLKIFKVCMYVCVCTRVSRSEYTGVI
jgi:hypothetical protein